MPDLKKTELWVAIAGMVAAIGAAVLDSGLIAASSTVAAIVGVVVIAAAYIAGRSWEKAARAGRSPNVALYPSSGRTELGRSIETKPPPTDGSL